MRSQSRGARCPVHFCERVRNHDVQGERNFDGIHDGGVDEPRAARGRTL